MKNLLLFAFSAILNLSIAQPWSPSGTCDFTDGQQWNNGGAKGCACTWYSVEGTDTVLNCAFGDCGQNALYECVYDCNGHNGYTTDNIPRQCDGTANPVCWFNGAGSAGELFCQGIALPIELIDFVGVKMNGYNQLTWRTASEYNASHYSIQQSTDGYNWMTFAFLPAAGNSTIELKYNAMHLSPEPVVNYYRLIQYDFDGKYEMFEIISIDNRSKEERIVKTINTIGLEVDENYRGIIINIFEDGSIERSYR
jgi:hypothetical protein